MSQNRNLKNQRNKYSKKDFKKILKENFLVWNELKSDKFRIHDNERTQECSPDLATTTKKLDVTKTNIKSIRNEIETIDLCNDDEDISEKSISTMGNSPITAHGSLDEPPPDLESMNEIFKPRNVQVEKLDQSVQDFHNRLISQIIEISDIKSDTSMENNEQEILMLSDNDYTKKIKSGILVNDSITSTKTEIKSDHNSNKPTSKTINASNKSKGKTNASNKSKGKTINASNKSNGKTINASNKSKGKTTNASNKSNGKQKCTVTKDPEALTTDSCLSRVEKWFQNNADAANNITADALASDCMELIMEKLDTTFVEINEETSRELVDLFVRTDVRMREMQEEQDALLESTASDITKEVFKLINTSFIEMDKKRADLFAETDLQLRKSNEEHIALLKNTTFNITKVLKDALMEIQQQFSDKKLADLFAETDLQIRKSNEEQIALLKNSTSGITKAMKDALMEMIKVNEIFTNEITKLDSSMQLNLSSSTPSYRLLAQKTLQKIVDQLGEQSAQAQGLNKVITTFEKMRNSTNTIYLLKDADANGGLGEVIGFLKTGHKKLFLFDEEYRTHEVEPLCVLDFFVLPALQRHGYGKKLFDYMLQDTGSQVEQLAVDGPSPRLQQFLFKNYGVDRLVRQSNNFAITPQFFPSETSAKKERGVAQTRRKPWMNSSGRNTPVEAHNNFGRFAARKPTSSIGKIIHGEKELSNSLHEPVKVTPSPSPAATPAPSPAATPAPPPAATPAPPLSFGGSKPPSARPSTLSVEPAVRLPPPRAMDTFPADGAFRPITPETPAGVTSLRDGAQFTKRGYFDIKNYHNKLW